MSDENKIALLVIAFANFIIIKIILSIFANKKDVEEYIEGSEE